MTTAEPKKADTITTRLLDLTTEYAAIDAVSGHEHELVTLLATDLQPYCDSVAVDAFGNVIGTRTGPESSSSLMIAAHSDEIGAVVKAIEPDGAIRFEPIGGVLETLLVGRAVRVAGINGVIGSRAGHITPIEERRVAPPMNDLYVDVGCDSPAGVADLGIRTGDPIAYDAPVRRLGTSDRISGKAIDNRIGCALVVELAKALHGKALGCTVHFVITVQEEVGLRGAQMVTHRLNPTAAIIVDTMPSGGTPDVSSTRHLTMEIGKGPVLTLMSQSRGGGAIAQPGMLRFLERTATDNHITYQRALFVGGNSDAAAVHLVRSGIPTGILNLARRYSHSPVETLDLNDASALFTWLQASAEAFTAETDLSFLGADSLIDQA